MRLLYSCLCLAAMAGLSGCGGGGGDGDSGPRNPKGFINKASESEFYEKSDAFKAMLNKDGAHLSLGAESKSRNSGSKPSSQALAFLENMMGTHIPSATASADSGDCDVVSSAKREGGRVTDDDNYSFDNIQFQSNESCDTALGKLKSSYNDMIQTLPSQIDALRQAETLPSHCGIKVTKLTPNANDEAVGFVLTPSQPSSQADFRVEARGAANGDQIGLFFKFHVAGQSDSGSSNPMNASHSKFSMSIDADINNIGDLAAHSLDSQLTTAFSMAGDDVSLKANIAANMVATGMDATQLASIDETMTAALEASGVSNGKAEHQRVDSSSHLVIKEVSKDVFDVSAEMKANGQSASYHLSFAKDAKGVCRMTNLANKVR